MPVRTDVQHERGQPNPVLLVLPCTDAPGADP